MDFHQKFPAIQFIDLIIIRTYTGQVVRTFHLVLLQIEPGAPLPSPEMLKGRVLLKDKIRLKKAKE